MIRGGKRCVCVLCEGVYVGCVCGVCVLRGVLMGVLMGYAFVRAGDGVVVR